MEGYGEAVCFIVNDLTNRELIRRKFSFMQPSIHKMQEWDQYYNQNDGDLGVDDHLFQGSTVFDLSRNSELENHQNLKRNEQALKKTKDITHRDMSRKQIFDMINNDDNDI